MNFHMSTAELGSVAMKQTLLGRFMNQNQLTLVQVYNNFVF